MFLNRLTDAQKKAFLAIAMKIVGADRHLDSKERLTIEAMRYEMGLWAETDIPKGSIEELAQHFDTRQSQVVVMLESIGLAFSDEELHGEEQKILRALALIFGFSEKEATDMENWVLQFKKLQKEAVTMMSK
ncbi:MAG: hypothetical protein JSV88_32345 [Candidatus Aminicenantes bacterium]|nr:MAG: hypothetical protein JSV88_32345 [Candidatus Aminicenantes bacterium]